MDFRKPFDHNYFIGYISQVFPDFVRVHFPSSVLLNKFIFSGEEFNAGLVGNYVTIEGENHGFLGKILELSLPEKERLVLNENDFQRKDFHPAGKIEILLSFDYFNVEKVNKGLSCYPNIGSKVFVCTSEFIQTYFKRFGLKEDSAANAPLFDFGKLTSDNTTSIEVAQQALFGRHCAIVGTTGGGKSWTLSKCLEETIRHNGKAILIDATGEYASFDGKEKIAESSIIGENNFFHYSNLSIEDIFVLLRPSGQVQAPKLLDAIKSLKILDVLRKNVDDDNIKQLESGSFSIKISDGNYEEIKVHNGIIKKSGEKKRPYNRIYRRFISVIEGDLADFDIRQLSDQITAECVWDNENLAWGGKQDTHLNNCISLILRANSLLHNQSFDKIFGMNKDKSDNNELIKNINKFIDSDDCLFRIGFESVGFDFQIREILANAIGKYLLMTSRSGKFKTKPLVLFIDEAHQYLNKYVKDEYFELTRLSAFDQIAKECRKYGLFLCLATQMPRDIPAGTLSQMGTFIVHRLINPYDKEAIENACSSASRNSLSFLPILGEGEAILMGVDFPMPVILKVNRPSIEPNSKTPQF
ncbi:ATP-binding protein [Daejeonella sp. JGW-45]|uniref:ATP-binding protein n=1 Tax=Daejeonella sp. JGW-45 TaxID=3034148 RepID=UPI0023ED5074|nr:ATP-binding protein [Daejeonella sp. JGW-45]